MKSNHNDSKLIWEAASQVSESDSEGEHKYWSDTATAVERGVKVIMKTVDGIRGTAIDVDHEDGKFLLKPINGEPVAVSISDIVDVWREGDRD